MNLPEKIILKQFQSPGDVLMMTGLIRRLKEAYPDIRIRVNTCADDFLINNPYIDEHTSAIQLFDTASSTPYSQDDDGWVELITHYSDEPYKKIKVNNPWSIHKCGTSKGHFSQGFIGYFNALFNLKLKDTPARPEVYLTKDEKKPLKGLPKKYWVVVCGGKNDFLRKIYPERLWRELFKLLPGVKFVQLGIKATNHAHPVFEDCPNVINYIDKTSLRQMLTVVHNSQGVISPITQTIVQAAALRKPCIVLAGGGEDYTWQAWKGDKTFHYLHTLGLLWQHGELPAWMKEYIKPNEIKHQDCCRFGGCWGGQCSNILSNGEQLCMQLLQPEMIANIVKTYKKEK